MKNYLNELPENYKVVYCLNAKNVKTGIIFNVFALLILLIAAIAGFPLIKNINIFNINPFRILLFLLILIFALIVLIFSNPLLHSLIIFIFTGRKLKFGITWSCVYCGIPDIYLNKKTVLAASIIPFFISSAIITVFLIFITDLRIKYFIILNLSLNIGMYLGDLYVLFLFLFRFKGNVLVKDVGPEEYFYSDKI